MHPGDDVSREPSAQGDPLVAKGGGDPEGWAEVVLAMLVTRDLCVSWLEQEQRRVERDLARLERWSARVAACVSAAELLAKR
jgi:hypothetical protein